MIAKDSIAARFMLPTFDYIIKISEALILTATFAAAAAITGSILLQILAFVLSIVVGSYVGILIWSASFAAEDKIDGKKGCLAFVATIAMILGTWGGLYTSQKVTAGVVKMLAAMLEGTTPCQTSPRPGIAKPQA